MLIIGHRFAKNEARENTIAALKRAVRDGVTAVEFDVRLTKDAVPVVAHDAMLTKTYGLDLWISHNRFAALQQLTCEKVRAEVPEGASNTTQETEENSLTDLKSVLDIAASTDMKLMIELKQKAAVRPTLKLLSECFPDRDVAKRRIFISSFSGLTLAKMQRRAQQINYSFSYGLLRHSPLWPMTFWVRKLDLTAVGFANQQISASLVRRAAKFNLSVYAFARGEMNDSRRQLTQLADMGVVAAVVNAPAKVLKWQKTDTILRKAATIFSKE
jgi:glycerophosphoryl diester phosphodiesterase